MGKRKPGYTLEQHEQLGLELQTMRDRLNSIFVDLQNHYGRTDKIASMVESTCHQLDKLRDDLKDRLLKEQTDKKEADLGQVYFRSSRSDYVNPQPITPSSK